MRTSLGLQQSRVAPSALFCFSSFSFHRWYSAVSAFFVLLPQPQHQSFVLRHWCTASAIPPEDMPSFTLTTTGLEEQIAAAFPGLGKDTRKHTRKAGTFSVAFKLYYTGIWNSSYQRGLMEKNFYRSLHTDTNNVVQQRVHSGEEGSVRWKTFVNSFPNLWNGDTE